MSVKLKVMTFNLRRNVESDEENRFDCRADSVFRFLAKEQPDIIGFQEVNDDMRGTLIKNLASLGYITVGCGRTPELKDEAVCISYKADRFELLKYETKWLSPTPDIPGSRYEGDQSHWPRVFSAAVLRYDGIDDNLLFVNAHTDHKGSTARLLAGEQLVRYLADFGGKVILTGDLNAPPDTPEIQIFTKTDKLKLTDMTAKISGTFHGFGQLSPDKMTKIDYIFTNIPQTDQECYSLTGDLPKGKYLSDHNPVTAFIEI